MQDEEAVQRAVAQGFRTICICRGVRQRTIETAISKGATTLPDIRRKTMAMTGACGAKRCTGPIQGILRNAMEAARASSGPLATEPSPPSTVVASPDPAPPTHAPSAPPPAVPTSEVASPPSRKRRRRRRGGGRGGPPPQAPPAA